MARPIGKLNSTKLNYLIDLVIFVAFLLAMDPRTTGIAIHEWLSIAFAAAVIVHLLLHWQWIAAVTRRFLGRVARTARLNYILNTLLFIDTTIVIFTGLMISEAALPLFGIRLSRDFFWRWLHSFSADAALVLLGLHIALHWKWVVETTTRYLWKPGRSKLLTLTPKEVQP